jgi:hypothetical protein
MLPRREAPVGVRRKLATYVLDMTHEEGGPKASGFQRILGITLDYIDYLETEIRTGILTAPIRTVRENPPFGINCVVEFLLRGLDTNDQRTATLRTVWRIADADECPHLVTAYIRP